MILEPEVITITRSTIDTILDTSLALALVLRSTVHKLQYEKFLDLGPAAASSRSIIGNQHPASTQNYS